MQYVVSEGEILKYLMSEIEKKNQNGLIWGFLFCCVLFFILQQHK